MVFEPIFKGQAASTHGSRCLPFGRFCCYRNEKDKLTSDLLLLGCVVQATRVELTRSVAFHQPSSCKDRDRFLHQPRGGGAQNRCENLTIISYANIGSCLPRNLKITWQYTTQGKRVWENKLVPAFPGRFPLRLREGTGEGRDRQRRFEPVELRWIVGL